MILYQIILYNRYYFMPDRRIRLYTPPQDHAEILDLMTYLISYSNQREDDLSPLIRLTILHYQLESIHPFYDGNGRTGRILNILFIILNELIDVPILYLCSYIIDNKPEYYKLLNQTNQKVDWDIIYAQDH